MSKVLAVANFKGGCGKNNIRDRSCGSICETR